MPQFPPIPRLSIVIPIGPDLAAFESTLVSVLENRPQGTEIIVAHDGSYDDPFELCDEVRFVVAPSNRLDVLVGAAADESRGRFVHVLADGICATNGWAEAALEKFEHPDAGVVIPVICDRAENLVIAAGWQDRGGRLCRAAAAGQNRLNPRQLTGPGGAYLQASFWRRDLLRSLGDAFVGPPTSIDAAYGYAQLVHRAGWRSLIAVESLLHGDGPSLPWQSDSFAQNVRLRALSNHFRNAGWLASTLGTARAIAGSLNSPRSCAAAVGQIFAPLAASSTAARIEIDVVLRAEQREQMIHQIRPTGERSLPAAA